MDVSLSLQSKGGQMEKDVKNELIQVEATENILLQIFNDLGNLPKLNSNGLNIAEVLGVEARVLDERQKPNVFMKVDCVEIFSDQICVFLLVKNDSHLGGVISCMVETNCYNEADCKFMDCKYFLPSGTIRASTNSACIRSHSTRQAVVAIKVDAFQNAERVCTLIVDWLFLPPSTPNADEGVCEIEPKVLIQLNGSNRCQFAPLNYSFLIQLPSSQPLCDKSLDNTLEKDAMKILLCLHLTRKFRRLKRSSEELLSFFETCDENLFRTVDFGMWHFVVGAEASVWSNIIVYICPEVTEYLLPAYSAVFCSSELALNNFESFLSAKTNRN